MEQPDTFGGAPAPIEKEIAETRKDIGAVLDAVKELTKTISELVKQTEMMRKAGRF